MKKIMMPMLLLFALTGLKAIAQATDNVMPFESTQAGDTGIVMYAEQTAEFPGDLHKYISQNIRYPEADRKAGREGKVYLQFVIEKDGTISNITTIKSASETMDAEAIRVIESMPKWKPAKQNGKPVRLKFTLPILFKLR
jgi:periplasmic protein TonB